MRLVFDLEKEGLENNAIVLANINDIIERHNHVASAEYGMDTSKTTWRVLDGLGLPMEISLAKRAFT